MRTHAHGSAPEAQTGRTIRALLAVALLLALAGLLLSAKPAHAATATIEISGFAFKPGTVTIQVGDTVTWTNLDSTAHTATDTAAQPLFDGQMDSGESYSFTFTQPGHFDYVCTFHPSMTGTVVVQAAAGASQVPNAAMATPTEPGSATTALGVALLVLSLLAAAAVAGQLLRRAGS